MPASGIKSQYSMRVNTSVAASRSSSDEEVDNPAPIRPAHPRRAFRLRSLIQVEDRSPVSDQNHPGRVPRRSMVISSSNNNGTPPPTSIGAVSPDFFTSASDVEPTSGGRRVGRSPSRSAGRD